MSMKINIQEIAIEQVEKLAEISIAFEVKHILSPIDTDNGLRGIVLKETPVTTPYIKDYDADPKEGPTQWSLYFDLSNWGFLVVEVDNELIGGAVIAYRTKGLHMLEKRQDLAVLWDIRIHPDYRKQGLGSVLFREVEAWARAHHCTHLKVETQNINLPACKFYAGQGCELGAINRYAYKGHPDEIQLLWYKMLT